MQKHLLQFSMTAYTILLILIILVQIQPAGLNRWDQALNYLLTALRQSWITPVVSALTNFANPSNLAISNIILLACLLIFKQYTLSLLQLFNAILVGSVGNHLLKIIIMRPRPTAATHLVPVGGYSFPSGHAAASMVYFGFLILLTYYFVKRQRPRRWLMLLWVSLILLIGLSRVYIGVHNVSDVLAGWCWGLGGLCFSWWCCSKCRLLPVIHHYHD